MVHYEARAGGLEKWRNDGYAEEWNLGILEYRVWVIFRPTWSP